MLVVDGLGLSGKTKALVDLATGLDTQRYRPTVVCFQVEGSPLAETLGARGVTLLEVPIEAAGAREIAARARGTPRVANRLLRRARDFADVLGKGAITQAIAKTTAERLEVDAAGLDEMDRRLLMVIIEHYDGGPVGIDTIAAALSEPRDTIEDVYEPFLLQQGFLGRTPRGRIATRKAYEHLKVPFAGSIVQKQKELFDE